jgi:hypothetical protein
MGRTGNTNGELELGEGRENVRTFRMTPLTRWAVDGPTIRGVLPPDGVSVLPGRIEDF